MGKIKDWVRSWFAPTITYYSECGEFDQEKFDKIWELHHKTFEAMDEFFQTAHNPPTKPQSGSKGDTK